MGVFQEEGSRKDKGLGVKMRPVHLRKLSEARAQRLREGMASEEVQDSLLL